MVLMHRVRESKGPTVNVTLYNKTGHFSKGSKILIQNDTGLELHMQALPY
jgi:hypothetical protein